ncbi:MAG: TIGR04211 family SH3 domain-containing protein [Woeseia sp.]|nr:TIGR04211 family SH3 domain-containing protein [Woeseia sp.]MBT8095988.1 TIGR04211 family SH3 domain-containing protein [Woeseia sp.]NNE59490.1 TIGR04211 family SH3 domain-containing protein [Woeseia sp.]NNL54335.1 TIGR04211 family SH3 domain-containing protein [Woeseia sp.]
MRLILLVFLIFSTAQLMAQTETAYVTDTLRLGLHRAADTNDRAFQMLESGQQMTILERNRNYALIRLPEGTQGYVKAAYLVTEKPAKLIVAEAQAEAARLQQELVDLQQSFAQPAATIAALEQDLQSSNAALETSDQTISELNIVVDDYSKRFEQYKNSLPLRWVGGATAVCLLAGFLGGLWWTDYRSRKRHGGIRIY